MINFCKEVTEVSVNKYIINTHVLKKFGIRYEQNKTKFERRGTLGLPPVQRQIF